MERLQYCFRKYSTIRHYLLYCAFCILIRPTVSDENLDGKELSEIITASLMGSIVDKKTKEPLKLSNAVLMAGIRNRMNQLAKGNGLEE